MFAVHMTDRRLTFVAAFLAPLLFLFSMGCARLFGWNIHAPGILSSNFIQQVQPVSGRIALYFPPDLAHYQSKARGGKTADPQTFYIGESLAPMLVEGFQNAFEEFIFMELEPTPRILKQFAIPYLAVIQIKDFNNNVSWSGQAVTLVTETLVFDPDLRLLARFESKGTSEAEKVFAKKGGPEVNLNAALENNVLAIVQFLQDSMRSKAWEKKDPT